MTENRVAGATIELQLDDAKAQAQLEQLIARMSNRAGFFKNVGEHMVNSTIENFKNETEANGAPWTPLSPARIRQREREKLVPITILRARGALAGSTRYQVSPDELQWGTTAPYAAIHQLGGEITIPERKQTMRRHFDPKLNKSTGRFVSKSAKAGRDEEISFGATRITIPARPYLGVGPDDEREIFEIAKEWLEVEGA